MIPSKTLTREQIEKISKLVSIPTIATKGVAGLGNPVEANIVILDTCPGTSERQLGRPFSGISASLLKESLSSAGIPSSFCYLTYLIKKPIFGKNMDALISFPRGASKKEPVLSQEYLAYEDMLIEELSKSNANLFVALGELPLFALTRMRNSEKRRGSLYYSRPEFGTRKVLCTYSPQSCTQAYLNKYLLARDLTIAKKESAFKELVRPQTNLIINPSFYDSMCYIKKCLEHRQASFDIEVTRYEMSCFSLSCDPKEAICIPLIKNGKDYFDPEQERSIIVALGNLLEHPDVEIWGQNLGFDSSFMHSKYFITIDANRIQDTMIGQQILSHDFPKGLDFITSLYTNEPYYKDEGKQYMRIGGDENDFFIYNAKDSIVVQEAFPKIKKELEECHNWETYRKQVELLNPLLFLSRYGIAVDVPGLRKEKKKSEERIAELTTQFKEIAGDEVNPNSPKSLANYFYVTKRLPTYRDRKTHSITTGAEALKRIARKGYPEANILLERAGERKLATTYYCMHFDEDERMRCSWNPVGTAFGRLSSSKTIFNTGGNQQNLPLAFKQHVHADPGFVLYNIDLAKAENKVVAYIGPDYNMIKAFEENIDLHSLTASLIFGKPIEEISDEPGSSTIGTGLMSERFWGKKANHGLNYGLGYKNFSLTCEIPEKDGKFIKDKYYEAYPGVPRYHSWVQEALRQNRSLVTPFGRTITFLDRWGDSLFQQAYSSIPQNTVATIMNRWGLCYIYDNQDLFHDVYLLNTVHDSIVFQIPLSQNWNYHSECLTAIRNNLEQELHWKDTPFVINADITMQYNMVDKVKLKDLSANALSNAYDRLGHSV